MNMYTHMLECMCRESLLLQQDVQRLVPVLAAFLVGLVDPLLLVAHLPVAHYLLQVVHCLQYTGGWGWRVGGTSAVVTCNMVSVR